MKAEMALIDGEKHLILENYAKALELFETAKDINPDDGAIHFKIAEVLYKNESYDKAIRSAERALELSPNNKFYYVLTADIQMGRSDLLSAQKTYERLILLPDTQEYLGYLALIYEYQGKYKLALETYAKVQDHFGTNEAILEQKKRIYEQIGQPEMVVKEWERLVKENPSEETFVYSFANQLINYNQVARAEQVLMDQMNRRADDDRASLMLAEVMKRQGKMEQAMKYARASLLAPDVPFDLKGNILNDLLKSTNENSTEEMKQLVMDVASVHPKEHTAQAFAGDVLFQLNDKRSALDYYISSTKISPDNFSVWQNILSLESEFELWDDLIKHSDQAIEYFPNQAAFYYFGGTAYLKKENYNRAVSLLELGKRYAINKELRDAFDVQIATAKKGLK